MKVFIAEKPSIAKAIATELKIIKREDGYYRCNGDNIVTNCFGHLLELEEPDFYLPDSVPLNKNGKKAWRLEDLPIIPKSWHKLVKKDAKKQLKIIGELLKKADTVVNAGDPDREGQLLVDEVLEYFKYKGKVLRYWQSAMDSTSVRRALGNLESNNKYHHWGSAASARSQADWLLGMNLTRLLTLKNRSGQVISAGRVQSTTLKLIVDRDLAIKNFKPQKFYTIDAEFKNNKGSYIGNWIIPEDLKDQNGYLTNQALVNEAINRFEAHSQQAEIISFTQNINKEEPKLLYTLTSLQVDCSSKFGFSANKTLSIAQKLYEEYKLTSYPRTSCPYLPQSQKGDVPKILENFQKTFPEWTNLLKAANPDRASKIWNDNKVNEEAHTGLTPTLQGIDQEKFKALPIDCQKVYDLIARRYVATFLPDQTYYETKIETKLTSGDLFKSTGKQIISEGWKALFSKDKSAKKSDQDEEQNLPTLRKGEIVSLIKTKINNKQTTPPAYFTEGSLVKAMEEIAKYIDDPKEKKLLKETSGIGTAATRASIIERLKTVGYIKLAKNKLVSTDFGQQVVQIIPARLKSASLTAQAEDELKQIQNGLKNAADYQKSVIKLLTELFEEAKMTENINHSEQPKCPKCGGRIYRNEMKTKGKFYFHCADCKTNFNDENGKIGAEWAPANKCPECGQNIYRYQSKKDPKQYYWWCKNCNSHFTDLNGKIGEKAENKTTNYPECKCPNCGKTAKRYPNKQEPSKYHWWCKDCNSNFKDDNGKIGEKLG